jgi:hypothetical protein
MKYVCVNASLDECAGREHPHEAYDNEVEERLAIIDRELNEIKDTLAFIRDTIVKADTTITTVATQVMPTIEEVMKSPIMKMFGGKK